MSPMLVLLARVLTDNLYYVY